MAAGTDMQEMTHRLTLPLRRLQHEHHDSCASCGYLFKEDDTTHLGYDAASDPLYVCDKCSRALVETAARYRFSARPYIVPEPSARLWRYMDFTKYVSMLASHGLYFARADRFEDSFEGAKGLKKNKKRWDDHYLAFLRHIIRNPPPGNKCELSDSEVEEQAQKLLLVFQADGEKSKKLTFLNCWYESEHESEAMWRLYASYLPNAIAVKTSYQSLYLSLGRNPSISIGRVQYIDLATEYAGPNEAFWRKRKSFEHEREVRALLVDLHTEEPGKTVPCDLSLLIEQIFVSPRAPSWLTDLVDDVSNKYGLLVNVSTSQLIEEPFF